MGNTIEVNIDRSKNVAYIKMPWPPPPEKDQIKLLGARWQPDDKIWQLRLNKPSINWLIEHGLMDLEPEDGADTNNVLDPDQIPCPNGLSYKPFQATGIATMLQRPSTLLADEMGLGKTVQAIGLVNADDSVQHVLIVSPLSVTINWQRELERWLTRDLSVGLADTKTFPDTDIVIVHWSIISRYADALRSRPWDVIVLDEAHYAKNPKAQRTRAIFGGRNLPALQAEYKLALTGTPIPSRPIEMFPILRWLAPEDWSWKHYATRYCAGYQNRYGWDVSGASHLDELNDNLKSIMVRRRKTDVLKELPPITRQIVEVPADTPELRAVLGQESNIQKQVKQSVKDARINVELAKTGTEQQHRDAVAKLREARVAAFNEMSRARHDTAVAKIPYVAEHVRTIIGDNDNQKIIVFAHHHDVINGLQDLLSSDTKDMQAIRTVTLMGGDETAKRQNAIDLFQNDPQVKVFIASIQAAKEGITLTASDLVIFSELDWVPGNLSQAEARCHRIGQENHVLVQHLLLNGSLDARMARVVLAKQDILDAALDRQPHDTDSDNPEELDEILDEIFGLDEIMDETPGRDD